MSHIYRIFVAYLSYICRTFATNLNALFNFVLCFHCAKIRKSIELLMSHICRTSIAIKSHKYRTLSESTLSHNISINKLMCFSHMRHVAYLSYICRTLFVIHLI